MSELITTAVVVYIVYQLAFVILQKKGPQKETKKPGRSSQLPSEGPTPRVEPRSAAELMPVGKPGSLSDYYVSLEGTQGVEGTPGIEGTGDYIGILGPEGYKSDRNTGGIGRGEDSAVVSGVLPALTEEDLRKGIVWAEILGKPRARRPFRGSRI